MLISDYYHLTYCTNIHPGENWKITFDNLEKYVPLIKKEVAPNENFGLGLRLSNKASEELGFEKSLESFKNWLDDQGVYVYTMNGFPYGNFHGERVKDMVHAPDWTQIERVNYTKRLFKQLAYLLPKGISGGISTSPISYKYWHKTDALKKKALVEGAKNMVQIATQLFQIEKETGKYMHLDIEPEPDGLLENSDEVVDFFHNYLLPIGCPQLKSELGFSQIEAENCIKKYLTVCYDVCHFSLAYEEPEETFHKFESNGIKVGKIQVSSALKILFNDGDTDLIWKSLKQFDEPTYLHQITEKTETGVKTYSDLPELLKEKKSFSELRAHFHVPIFLEKFDGLSSTQDQILKVVKFLKNNKVCDHLEIETYTWEVLPINLKKELASSIVREMEWLKAKL
ncbi:xylose isomerase [Flagellimonas eckloniae]|uniref:Xylose isomerase n=2 Tax=Flagellimonas eckloniae TaxID=346185 RepID=A0A0Q0WVC1_9FLAO|nr:xylose isomerase [Allomuricauda eckloniae]